MPIEINTKKGTKEEAGGIQEYITRIKDARSEIERQWFVNVMFLYGKHHFTLNQTSKSIGQSIVWELEAQKSKNTIRRTSNYILPLYRSVYSRLIRQKGTVSAESSTQDQNDRDAAKASKEVAEHFWANCNRNNIWVSDDLSGMQCVLMKLIQYQLTLGVGYLFPYFNPKAKTFVYDEMRKDTILADVGEAEVRVDSPMNVFCDRFNRFVIHRRFICPEQVKYEFDKKVEPSKIDEDSAEVKILRMLEGNPQNSEDKDGVYVYHKYCLPTEEHPKGRVLVTTEDDVLFDGDLPSEFKERIPRYEFKYQDLGFSNYGQGVIEQVVDLQQDYNFTLARIAQHKKMLTGKVLAPRGGKLSAKWNDVVGQIIMYKQGLKPSMESAPPIPQYYFQEIQRIRSDMENMMNSHDVSMGRTPGQVKSGKGIENLSEKDDEQNAPEMIMLELKLGFFMESVLDVCQHRYQERRLLDISGEDMAYQVKSFIGSDLMGRKNISVKMGSMFPINKNEKINFILMLKKEGFISPERAKEMIEVSDVEGAFTNLDEISARQDILSIIEQEGEVIPELYEDHTIVLKVINDFRKGNVYRRLDPQVREQINALADIHQQMLLQEQEAAMRMGGPLPPPARPQMEQQT